MHHISNDKRSRRSANLIWEALCALMREKPFDQITVTDLQKASGVARTTFYRSFDNISDVLYWKCGERFDEVIGSYQPQELQSELSMARHYFSYWTQHADILELLMKIHRPDIIYACHFNSSEALQDQPGMMEGLWGSAEAEGEAGAAGPTPEYKRYFVAISTSVTIGVLTAWLEGGEKESVDELVTILDDVLTRCLSKTDTPEC